MSATPPSSKFCSGSRSQGSSSWVDTSSTPACVGDSRASVKPRQRGPVPGKLHSRPAEPPGRTQQPHPPSSNSASKVKGKMEIQSMWPRYETGRRSCAAQQGPVGKPEQQVNASNAHARSLPWLPALQDGAHRPHDHKAGGEEAHGVGEAGERDARARGCVLPNRAPGQLDGLLLRKEGGQAREGGRRPQAGAAHIEWQARAARPHAPARIQDLPRPPSCWLARSGAALCWRRSPASWWTPASGPPRPRSAAPAPWGAAPWRPWRLRRRRTARRCTSARSRPARVTGPEQRGRARWVGGPRPQLAHPPPPACHPTGASSPPGGRRARTWQTARRGLPPGWSLPAQRQEGEPVSESQSEARPGGFVPATVAAAAAGPSLPRQPTQPGAPRKRCAPSTTARTRSGRGRPAAGRGQSSPALQRCQEKQGRRVSTRESCAVRLASRPRQSTAGWASGRGVAPHKPGMRSGWNFGRSLRGPARGWAAREGQGVR